MRCGQRRREHQLHHREAAPVLATAIAGAQEMTRSALGDSIEGSRPVSESLRGLVSRTESRPPESARTLGEDLRILEKFAEGREEEERLDPAMKGYKSSAELNQDILDFIANKDLEKALNAWRRLSGRVQDHYNKWLARTTGAKLMAELNRNIRYSLSRAVFWRLMEKGDVNVDQKCIGRFFEALYVKTPDGSLRISDQALDVLERTESRGITPDSDMLYWTLLMLEKDGRVIESRERLERWVALDNYRRAVAEAKGEVAQRLITPSHFTPIFYGVLTRMESYSEMEDIVQLMKKNNLSLTERHYSILVQASYIAGEPERVPALIEEARSQFGEKNSGMLDRLACGLATGKDWDGLQAMIAEMVDTKVAFSGTLVARLIRMYTGEQGLQVGITLFENAVRTGTKPIKEMYDQIIQACFNSDEMETALAWFQKMLDAGFLPDEKTMTLLFEYLYSSGRASGYTYRRLYRAIRDMNPDLISTTAKADLALILQRSEFNVEKHLKDSATFISERVTRQQMTLCIKARQFHKAVEIFIKLADGLVTPKKQTVFLALRAAFYLDEAPSYPSAKKILDRAKTLGIHIEQDQVKEVFRFVHHRENPTTPHLMHEKDPRLLPIYEADILLRKSQPEAAIPIIKTFISNLSRARDLFYLQRGYTMLLRANLERRDQGGIREVFEGMQSQDVMPDLFFIRLITKRLRSPDLPDIERKFLRTMKDLAKEMMNESQERTADKAGEWVKVLREHFRGRKEQLEKMREEKRIEEEGMRMKPVLPKVDKVIKEKIKEEVEEDVGKKILRWTMRKNEGASGL